MGCLEGKVAFLTGAESGIAPAAARLFTQEGARVAIAELRPELGPTSERWVHESGGEATLLETDAVSTTRFGEPSSAPASWIFCTTALVVQWWKTPA